MGSAAGFRNQRARKQEFPRQTPAHEAEQPGHPVLRLQRAVGNQAVQRMMRAQEGDFLQRKLAVNEPGDAFEQEADRVSEQVMRSGEPGPSPAAESDENRGHGHGRVQLKAEGSSGTGTREAPPIVDEVLRSPGQPLDAGTRAFMEPRFGHDFSGVRVHTDAKAAESARALGAEAYASGSHIALPRPASVLGTQEGARLMAHELTHVIQQSHGDKTGIPAHTASGAVPVVALKPKPEESKFVGMRLGNSTSDAEARVTKEVGPPEGYDDKVRAIAAARIHKADPAAVVQSYDRKWHALELSAPWSKGVADAPVLAAFPLPRISTIADERKKEDALRERWSEMHRVEPDSEALRRDQKEKEAMFQPDWDRAKISRAEAVLGVPDSEIKLNQVSSESAPGKINIIEKPVGGGDARTDATGGVRWGSAGAQYAIQVDLNTLQDPAEAALALFHETIHMEDFHIAQVWADKYRKDEDSSFDPGDNAAFGRFQDWVNAQRRQGKISNADAEIVVQLVGREAHPAGTEIRANLRTVLELLRAGQRDLAAKKLVAYAVALKTGDFGAPSERSYVRQELIKELSAAYQGMSETMREDYDAAIAAALKEYPESWLTDLDFSKTRKAKGAAK